MVLLLLLLRDTGGGGGRGAGRFWGQGKEQRAQMLWANEMTDGGSACRGAVWGRSDGCLWAQQRQGPLLSCSLEDVAKQWQRVRASGTSALSFTHRLDTHVPAAVSPSLIPLSFHQLAAFFLNSTVNSSWPVASPSQHVEGLSSPGQLPSGSAGAALSPTACSKGCCGCPTLRCQACCPRVERPLHAGPAGRQAEFLTCGTRGFSLL